MADSEIQHARESRQSFWEDRLPADSEQLWAWIMGADNETVTELLAYCTARSLTGTLLHSGTQTMAPLIKALGVDMTEHWKPNAAYFQRIRKDETLKVLAQYGHTDGRFAKLKRDVLAGEAADLLADTGWLPPSLAV